MMKVHEGYTDDDDFPQPYRKLPYRQKVSPEKGSVRDTKCLCANVVVFFFARLFVAVVIGNGGVQA